MNRDEIKLIANSLTKKRQQKFVDLSWAISRDRLWMREMGLLIGNEYTPLGIAVRDHLEEAKAMEARQGGNGEAGAVHDSAVPEGNLP